MTSNNPKILFVEDEVSLAEIIKDTLESRRFEVVHVTTATQAVEAYHGIRPDIILLDVSLPDSDGYAFARFVRQTNVAIPILFLTSRSLPQDVIKGFESGGNDYVKKPFNIEELIVRIKALLSHNRTLFTQQDSEENKFEIGSYSFYYRQAHLQKEGRRYPLTSREAELLKLLLLNKNQVLERSTILKQIWGADDFFSGRSMDVFITKLRKHLKEDPSIQIMNVRGVGYKLLF